jgi:membrane-associated protease RseP (regulator of RpoE activity)
LTPQHPTPDHGGVPEVAVSFAPVRLAALVATLVLAGACGTQLKSPQADANAVAAERERQREFALTELMRRQARVDAIAARLRVAGADLCGDDISAFVGMSVASTESFDAELRPVAASAFGLDAKPRVLRLSPGQPAEQAGLVVGDAIATVDGKPVRTPREVVAQLARHTGGGPVELGIERSEGLEFVSVTPVPACDYAVVAVPNDTVNAYADGDDVGVHTGMIRFTESDDELALVIGHEFAHNALGHNERKTANTTIGSVLGTILDVGAGMVGVPTGGVFSKLGAGVMNSTFSKGYEGEADYLGLYFASRAGYDVGVAPDFWRRMGVEHPSSVESEYLSVHPSTPERTLSLEQAVTEIRDKRAAGLILEPARSD